MTNAAESCLYRRLMTGDETRIYHWDPESMAWKHKNSLQPVKFETASASKIMATFLGDEDGVLLINYLPPENYGIKGLLRPSAGSFA